MTNAVVRAAANQFVSLLEGNDSAPVGSQMPARPNRDGHARGREHNTDPSRGVALRNEAYPQPPVVRAGPKEVKRGQQRQYVTKPLPPRFAPFRLLQLERRDDPVQTEHKPERVDPLPLR